MNAVKDGQSTAIVDATGVFTVEEVSAFAHRLANRILDLCLAPEDRVAILSTNNAFALMTHLGVLLSGASVVPLNTHLAPRELIRVLLDSNVRVVIAEEVLLDRLFEHRREIPADYLVVLGASSSVYQGAGIEEWVEGASTEPPPTDIPFNRGLLYTSGTTGFAKAVRMPENMFPGGETVGEALERSQLSRFAPFGTHLVAGPLYHTGPLQAIRLLAMGKRIVVPERFEPASILDLINKWEVETSVMVPTHFSRFLRERRRYPGRWRSFPSLRKVSHTGAPTPVDLKREMLDWWGPVLVDSYGATEAGVLCSIDSDEWEQRQGSVGRPCHPYEVIVVDDFDRVLGPNQVGTLYFKDKTGAGIEYLNDEVKTKQAHRDTAEFTLGDIGYVDTEGFVYFKDRGADVILSGGVSLYPAEIEAALAGHPAVRDLAVIGVPDEDLGESVRAIVCLNPNVIQDDVIGELAKHCRETVGTLRAPRSFLVVDHVLHNAMGKIDRRRLRDRYLCQRAIEVAPA